VIEIAMLASDDRIRGDAMATMRPVSPIALPLVLFLIVLGNWRMPFRTPGKTIPSHGIMANRATRAGADPRRASTLTLRRDALRPTRQRRVKLASVEPVGATLINP